MKELQVSMFQALVLLLFNEKLDWTFEEIETATKIGKFPPKKFFACLFGILLFCGSSVVKLFW